MSGLLPIVTPAQMSQLDNAAIQEYQIPGLILMENAGRNTAEYIIQQFTPQCSQGVAILCGPGNNGGDGFVIARHLFQKNLKPHIFSLASIEKFKGDALTNYKIAKNLNIPFSEILTDEDAKNLPDILKNYGLIVDAIFGTGLSRPVSGRFEIAIKAANSSSLPIIAVDIPSGLSGLTGQPLGIAIKATATCTMALPKIGLVTSPGFEYTGDLHIIEIGIPKEAIQSHDIKSFLLTKSYAASIMPKRPLSGHKGTFGHLLIISGSKGKTGAAALCATGAIRSGAGLVTLAIPETSQPIVATKLTEAMTLPIPENQYGSLSKAAIPIIYEQLHKKKAIALGPGSGIDQEAQEALLQIITESEIPLVVDADGLTALANRPEVFKTIKAPLVLTPHPGEMARLLKCSTKEVQADRVKAASQLANDSGAVVVLKGARTVIADPDGRYVINPTGNPGLGTGGMGDVLTGIIGALIAQACPIFEAACLGVYAHGLAADQLALYKGPWGYIATEVADWLPKIWAQLLQVNLNE